MKKSVKIGDLIRAELLRGTKVKADRKGADLFGVSEEEAGGMGIELVDNIGKVSDDPDEQNIVVCVPTHWPTPFTDNETGHCIECGQAIVYRPGYDPRMVKVCTPCVMGFDIHAELLKKEDE